MNLPCNDGRGGKSPVGSPDLEEGLGVLAHGTDLGGLCADVDVSTVAAFPHDDLVLLEDNALLLTCAFEAA